MCIKRIARNLRQMFRGIISVKPELAEESLEDKPLLKEKRLARVVRTSRGGPNMPKYQPCPRCHGGAKRREKMGELGANYFCRRHQASFVVKA